MRIMEWWQQAGATSAWLPAVARAGLVAEVGQSIDALDPELRELTSALLLCQKSDHLQALERLDSLSLYDRFNGFISLIKARIFAELGDFANVIRELQNAERLHVDEQILAEVSDLLLSRDVNSHGEPIQGPGRCQCEEWERALGEFINCLPRDIQSHIHNRTPAFVWLTDDSIVAMFAITLDMKQAEYASALQLIEDNYSGSRSKGHLFLLRARILAALEEFDEMFLCLQGAAELCDDTEMFQLVFDELSTTVMDQLKAKQTNDAHIGLDSNLDERPKNMDWNEGDQPRWVATPGDESNLQAALKSARDKQQNCEYADAIHEYQRALALCPDIDYVKGNLAFCMANACVWDGLEALMKEIETEAKSGTRVIDPFCAALLLDDPKLQRQVAEAFSNGCFPESPNALWRGENYHHSRTRVAYLSADYHGHATAYLIAELLESHNKDKFETYGISYGKDVNDSMRSRLSKAFDHFIDVNGKNDREVAELMRAMEIDIAIDLKGFTPNSRPGILANRPCPVQAQYLGFPGTMGSPFIDYIIADYVIIPESHEPYFSEKVLRFTGTYQPTTDISNRSEHKLITRSDEGLPSDGFVYCCFNNNYKITPEIFDVWMNILRETPGSVLWLLEGNEDAPENLRFEALKRGIEPERLIFAAKKSVEDHLARHQLADLFLDTAPCNAHTTASDALNAGLPVLTIMGDTFASRVAASVGQGFDSGLTVARDLDEYTQIAVQQQPSSVAEKRSVAATMAEELEKMFQGALEDAIERASDKASCVQGMPISPPFFEIIITGLRLGEFVEDCLSSVTMQTYKNYRVHLLSDMDPENSIGAAFKLSGAYQFPSEPVVKSVTVRVGKAALIYDHLMDFEFGENSIIVILDGDDRFASVEALEIFAKKYQSENPDVCWSTYIRSDGVLGHSAPLIKGFDHRRQGWKSSHCFTFRAGLIKHVPRSYILDEVGNPVMQACDIALALPILDLADRRSFIPEALYHYTVDNPQSHHNQSDGVGLTSKRQMETAKYLYRKTPLTTLNS